MIGVTTSVVETVPSLLTTVFVVVVVFVLSALGAIVAIVGERSGVGMPSMSLAAFDWMSLSWLYAGCVPVVKK